jgi:hypothetical protein
MPRASTRGPDFRRAVPAEQYENILSKGYSGRNEAGADRSSRSEVETVCSQSSPQGAEGGNSQQKRYGKCGREPLPPLVLEESCLSYDFIDLQYINMDFGSGYFSKDNGYGAGFSKSITRDFFVNGSYSFGEFDDAWCGCNDMAENHKYRLRSGFRKEIADCVDLTFEGGGEFLDSEYQKNTDRSFDSRGLLCRTRHSRPRRSLRDVRERLLLPPRRR